MTVDRLSVAADDELGRAIREAARREGASISAWLVAAAEDRLRNELLGRTLDAWEAEHGAFPPEYAAEASSFFDRLGVPRPTPAAKSA